jgi:hypothetical protein
MQILDSIGYIYDTSAGMVKMIDPWAFAEPFAIRGWAIQLQASSPAEEIQP